MSTVMSRVSKAIAGGIAGAVTGASTYVAGGGTPKEELGKFALAVLGGFVVGFVGVYISPANEIPAVRR